MVASPGSSAPIRSLVADSVFGNRLSQDGFLFKEGSASLFLWFYFELEFYRVTMRYTFCLTDLQFKGQKIRSRSIIPKDRCPPLCFAKCGVDRQRTPATRFAAEPFLNLGRLFGRQDDKVPGGNGAWPKGYLGTNSKKILHARKVYLT